MEQGFFTALPFEIMIDIIARLPVRAIISCKCVCKPWLRLIKSHEFNSFHLSKSAPLLAVHHEETASKAYSFFEIEQGLDLRLHFDPVTRVNLRETMWALGGIRGSVNGFLFLLDRYSTHGLFLVCNPITRQYIALPYPRPACFNHNEVTCGFGASRITGQLKVVRIFKDHSDLYALGTGSWRRIAYDAALKYVGGYKHGSFLNGNLHWLAEDVNGCLLISCFDLEKEVFSTFSTPNCIGGASRLKLVAPLGNSLCVCEDTGCNIIIWLMNEYGVEKSWAIEYVIGYSDYAFLYPIKVLKDGGLLIAWEGRSWEDMIQLSVHYSKKNGVSLGVVRLDCAFFSDAILHTPSFLSLENFGMEDVRSF